MKKHNDKVYFSLLQLNKSIKNLIEGINKSFWINAEIAQVQLRRHAYLELVQKEEEKIVANNRANIWENRLTFLKNKFGESLENVLQEGNKVLVEVVVTYHEIYGISLNIIDIEPSYTIGELELQRLENLKKLEEKGLLFLQRELSLPKVIQKIAIISSPTAAGLSDFQHQLKHNEYGYVFHSQLFPAAVQGAHAAKEIITTLQAIPLNKFDVIIIIRGGGSRLDLEIFNDYNLAETIAKVKLPILTGIGHQRDETIADNVAYRDFKTPTAVAEFLIDVIAQYEYELISLGKEINNKINHQLIFENNRLSQLQQNFKFLISQNLKYEEQGLNQIQLNLNHSIKQFIQNQNFKLQSLEDKISSFSVEKWQKLGLYRVEFGEKPLKPNEKLKEGDNLTFYKEENTINVEIKNIE